MVRKHIASFQHDSILPIMIPILLIVLFIVYVYLTFTYSSGCRRFRTTNYSIEQLLGIRRLSLGNSIDPLSANTLSVCSSFLRKTGIYSQLKQSQIALVNWRPLAVRLTGYLGGICSTMDGVFDMVKGVQLALSLGARSFVFDIDYLDKNPCEPRVIHRDSMGFMRSLHTGSIKDGMETLNKMAFTTNYDPVIVIVYLRRIPQGKTQKDKFFKAISASLDPLTKYHLGVTEQGNFHNCRSESNLFTSEIVNFQKKFIVLCNYNTNLLPLTRNPKDNLDFWVNARLYQHDLGKSGSLGAVTAANLVPTGQIAYAQVGSTDQFIQMPDSAKGDFQKKSSNVFTVALGPVDESLTTGQLSILLNGLGIQCVPIDVIRLGENKNHTITLKNKKDPSSLSDLSNSTNNTDPLSYWTYAGWARKNIIEGFANVPVSAPIPGFIIPPPTIPKKPPPSTNSNGGLVHIS